MARSDRQKASDVFREANFVFARKVPFEEAFPEIESIAVAATEGDYGQERRAYWSRGEYVDCSNSLCYNGGVSVGSMIRSMVRDRQTEATFTELCQGYEGSPKGRRRYRKCLHHFEIRIQISYKPDASEAAPGM